MTTNANGAGWGTVTAWTGSFWGRLPETGAPSQVLAVFGCSRKYELMF